MPLSFTYSINELWTSHIAMGRWEAILIASFFLLCNIVIYLALWCMLRGFIMEYGYPRLKAKTLKKRLKNDSRVEKICMFHLCCMAQRKGGFLWLCWLMNLLSIVSVLISFIGAVSAIITHATGWSMCLIFAPFVCFAATVILLFVPSLVFLPSERKRYFKK